MDYLKGEKGKEQLKDDWQNKIQEYAQRQQLRQCQIAVLQEKVQLPHVKVQSKSATQQTNLSFKELKVKSSSYHIRREEEKNSTTDNESNSQCSESPRTLLIETKSDAIDFQDSDGDEEENETDLDIRYFNKPAQNSKLTNIEQNKGLKLKVFIFSLLSLFITQCFLIKYIIDTRID